MKTTLYKTILAAGLFAALLSSGCGDKPAPNTQVEPGQPAIPTVVSGVEAEGEAAAAIPTETAAPAPQKPAEMRGPGSFDLTDPSAGMEAVQRYHAVLTLSFEGTQQGNSYTIEKVYDLVVDREQEASLLTQDAKDPAGNPIKTFVGMVGPIRYTQAGADQPCSAGTAGTSLSAGFEPASQLPHLLGAEEVGQETVADTATTVYQFDRAALGIGEEATASGKVWVAQDDGWVVKYELSMKSDKVFGEGISGEQRWLYEVSEVGSAEIHLPETCPPVLADFPVPQEASNTVRLPGIVEYQVALAQDALQAFYDEQMTAQGWMRQGADLGATEGTRWLYSKQADGKELVAMITAKPEGESLQVRVFQISTDLPAAPAQ